MNSRILVTFFLLSLYSTANADPSATIVCVKDSTDPRGMKGAEAMSLYGLTGLDPEQFYPTEKVMTEVLKKGYGKYTTKIMNLSAPAIGNGKMCVTLNYDD